MSNHKINGEVELEIPHCLVVLVLLLLSYLYQSIDYN